MINSESLIEITFTFLEVWAFACSVLGNSIVIYVMTREKKLRRKSNYYIISVAVADLLIGLIGIPCSIYMRLTGGPKNSHLCLSFISFELGVFAVSIFSLVAVSIDRFFAICHPILYRKSICTTGMKAAIAVCWSLSIIGFFPLLGWNNGASDASKCHPTVVLSFSYIIFLCIFASFLPTLIIIAVYILIFKEINVQSKLRSTMVLFRKDSTLTMEKKEHKTAKTLSMVVSSFLICWLPLTISYFFFAVGSHEVFVNVLRIFTILSHFNSAIDPLIYALRIKNVRQTIRNLLKCERLVSTPKQINNTLHRKSAATDTRF